MGTRLVDVGAVQCYGTAREHAHAIYRGGYLYADHRWTTILHNKHNYHNRDF